MTDLACRTAIRTPLILMFATVSLQMQWPVVNAAAEAEINSMNSPSPLSPALLNKVLDLIARKGIDREQAPLLANALGFAEAGQTWPYRQAVIIDSSNFDHGFAIGRNSGKDIVLVRRDMTSLYVFRVHRDGSVIIALIVNLQSHQITVRAPTDAQNDLNGEIAFWAHAFEAHNSN